MRAVALLLASLALYASGALGLDLKGISPGMSREEVDRQHPFLRCSLLSIGVGESECAFHFKLDAPTDLDTLAGERTRKWTFAFFDDRLERIDVEFEQDSFEALRASLSEKYGRPKQSAARAQNIFGAIFPVVGVEWSDPKDVLSTGRVDAPTARATVLRLESKGALVRRQKAEQEDKKRRLKDL